MNNVETNIYVKNTNSGLYINYNSYEPCNTKTPWIWAPCDRVHKMCSNVNLFLKQVAYIKKVMSWNGYPYHVRNKIVKCLETQKNTKDNNTIEQQNIAMIFYIILYAGKQMETMIKNLIRKFKRHLDKTFKLQNIYRLKKLTYYFHITRITSTKLLL